VTQLGSGMQIVQDDFLGNLRRQITAEVKSDIQSETIDRIIRVVGSALSGLTIPAPKVEVRAVSNPAAVTNQVDVTSPNVYVTNELELGDLIATLQENNRLMRECMAKMDMPTRRTVFRDSNNLIVTIVDEGM
jgi:hypothetical protein